MGSARQVILQRKYRPETRAFLAALTVAPNNQRAALYDDLFRTLIDGGAYPYLRGLRIRAAHDRQAGYVNLVMPSEVDTTSGTITYVPDVGMLSGTATAFINTGTAATAFGTINNQMFGVYDNLDTAESSFSIGMSGAANTWRIGTRNPSNQINLRISDGTSSSYSNTDSRGLWMAERTGASARALYKGDVLFANDATAATSLPTGTITIFRNDTTYSSLKRVAADFFGTPMPLAQKTVFKNALAAFLTPIGAA